MKITIIPIDTACVILNINGFRILTDPVLDKAGKLYHFGYGTFSRKTANPALSAGEIGSIDLVLLSHHQHTDNLDEAGKKFMQTVPLGVTTKPGAQKYKQAVGLDDWQEYAINNSKVPGLKITAVPAQHHPWWLPQFFSGKVIGFVITWDNQSDGALYISGDTVYFKGIEEITRRFKVNIAILHLGAVQFRYLTGWGRYTFNADEAIKTAVLMKANKVVPIHYNGWTHFKETNIKPLFDQSAIASRTTWAEKGKETEI